MKQASWLLAMVASGVLGGGQGDVEKGRGQIEEVLCTLRPLSVTFQIRSLQQSSWLGYMCGAPYQELASNVSTLGFADKGGTEF